MERVGRRTGAPEPTPTSLPPAGFKNAEQYFPWHRAEGDDDPSLRSLPRQLLGARGCPFTPLSKKIGAEVVLSVRAERPIVSEEYWDHFVCVRYPTTKAMLELYQSDAFHEINKYRLNALDGTLAVLSKATVLPE